jgi:hypothetical protein
MMAQMLELSCVCFYSVHSRQGAKSTGSNMSGALSAYCHGVHACVACKALLSICQQPSLTLHSFWLSSTEDANDDKEGMDRRDNLEFLFK